MSDFRETMEQARLNGQPIPDDRFIPDDKYFAERDKRLQESEKRRQQNALMANHKPSLEILLDAPRSQVRTLVKFCNTHFLRPRRISTGIGPSGSGKSNITEAMIASSINSHCDSLGLEVIPPPGDRPLLVIDYERTQDEILEGTDRIKRRIAAENNPDLLDDKRFKNVFLHGFLQYPSTEEKIKELQILIGRYKPYLVIQDGAASQVYDVNDTRECVYMMNLLLALADEHDLSFFCTVHPNPDQKSDFKPRGVFGSELLRQSESVLLLKRAPDDRDIRILTTSFMHGKNRSGNDNLEHYFRWNDTHKMFMSCHYTPPERAGKSQTQDTAFKEILDGKELAYSDLTKALMAAGYCNSMPTAKRWVTAATERQLIFKKNDTYGLTPF